MGDWYLYIPPNAMLNNALLRCYVNASFCIQYFTSALALMTRSSTTSSFLIPSLRHLIQLALPHAKQGLILPFSLVPIGSPALLINTQALSSNLTTLPSGLCSFFFVRTTTACLKSPLRTLFAADVETDAPGPDSGPKFLCF